MKKEQIAIDIRLDRSANYVESLERYNELQAELNCLDRQRDEVQAGIGSLANSHRDQIAEEAMSMLSGVRAADPSILKRDAMVKNLNEMTHRIAVLRQAVSMQKNLLESAKHEVGKAIACDLLPQHRQNVGAVVEAAIKLSVALQAEKELRDTLTENSVPFSSVIRAMGIPGFDLADNQSRLSRYLLESYEHALIGAGDLPDIVRDRLPPKAKPTPKHIAHIANKDGWQLA